MEWSEDAIVSKSLEGIIQTWNAGAERLLLGADPLGRDLWSRLLAGARLSLGVAACAVVLALALGALIGALGALATSRLFTALLFEVDPADPVAGSKDDWAPYFMVLAEQGFFAKLPWVVQL